MNKSYYDEYLRRQQNTQAANASGQSSFNPLGMASSLFDLYGMFGGGGASTAGAGAASSGGMGGAGLSGLGGLGAASIWALPVAAAIGLGLQSHLGEGNSPWTVLGPDGYGGTPMKGIQSAINGDWQDVFEKLGGGGPISGAISAFGGESPQEIANATFGGPALAFNNIFNKGGGSAQDWIKVFANPFTF